MAEYQLAVRGEAVHVTFKRINDSRRLRYYHTDKDPNLFGVRAAMVCTIKSKGLLNGLVEAKGAAFCYHLDRWNAERGRHEAIKDAFANWHFDKELRREIWQAFLAEEKRRMKAKGPARIPRTAQPKLRRNSHRQVLSRAVDALEQISQRLLLTMRSTEPSPNVKYPMVDIRKYPMVDIRPADTTQPAPTPFEYKSTAGANS